MIVTSYFTPIYAGEKAGFLTSGEKHLGLGEMIDVREVACRGSWRLNCGIKPEHILEVLWHHRMPVLWVDIDGRFRQPFSISGYLAQKWDFAAWFIPNAKMAPRHVPGGRNSGNDGIASGTMWFNYSAGALRWLEAWHDREDGQGEFEQQVMGDLWYELHVRGKAPSTYRLEQRYCKVFDVPWFSKAEDHGVVIEHMQASRRLKGKP
jgi:hypothetical protein